MRRTAEQYVLKNYLVIAQGEDVIMCKKVLITGAQGFIGSKMLELFTDKGYKTFGWGRENMENVESLDMLDESAVITMLDQTQPDIIVHCAGAADVGKSVLYPETDYAGNVTITHNLLFALHKLHIEHTRVVFLSSAGVYGNPEKLPITEDMPVNPLSPYALHKVMCEDMCWYFVRNYGMNIKIARIFSAYGAGLRKQIFWDMYKKAKNVGKLEMFGTGQESRDYIHIDDVAQALYLLATTKSNDVVFNVANGEEVTIRQATDIFAKCSGVPTENISFNGVTREGDPLNWRADISRIKKLGYKRTVDMLDGLRQYVEWVTEKG